MEYVQLDFEPCDEASFEDEMIAAIDGDDSYWSAMAEVFEDALAATSTTPKSASFI